MTAITGPFATFEEATAASGYGQARGLPGGPLPIAVHNRSDLAESLAGVELGAYDQRILEWLAVSEPATVAVICGLISRARVTPG